MIEIIALIFILRSIGKLATQKAQPPLRWKMYTLACWIGFEISGFLIGYSISHNIYTAMPLGLGAAFGGYLLIKYKLDSLPNLEDEHWMDRIGRQDR